MKKLLCFLLVFVLFGVSGAQAVTVKEFADEYNSRIGEGYPASTLFYPPEDGDEIWFLMGTFAGSFIALEFDSFSAETKEDCTVKTVFIRHKPRTSMGQFMAAATTAMAIIYPDEDSSTLADAIASAMAHSWILFGEAPREPIGYNTDAFGQLVYQETTEYDTFLFSAPRQ